jgi:hypothetical protein
VEAFYVSLLILAGLLIASLSGYVVYKLWRSSV